MKSTRNEETVHTAIQRVHSNIARFGDKFPYSGNGNVYVLSENTHWMTAFWTGQLWIAYAVTRDHVYRQAAEGHLRSFEDRLVNRIDESHDLGFLFTLSARAQWQLTSDPAARKLAVAAAERLISRFHPNGQYIQAWGVMNDPVEGGRVIIDTLMNLPLLFWATYETGNSKFADIALAHAQTTLGFLVRSDDTTFHTFFFDQDTGESIGGKTAQGYADDSVWSRGQAWAIYGYALAGDWTGEAKFIKASRRLAERFWMELSDDLIPLWDFRLPPEAPQKRDSSAGAIAACGMFKLSDLSQNSIDSKLLKERATQLVLRLTDCCFETNPAAQGLLRDSSYNINANRAVEQFMPFGDYFYLESMLKMNGINVDFWGKANSSRHV